MNQPVRVMICDDNEPIVEKYAFILDSTPAIMVVATAHSGKAAVELALSTKPDVILMDIEMETTNAGIVASQQILERLPDVKIVILTIYETDHLIFEAFSAGVVDYIIKTESPQSIIQSVLAAHNNSTTLSPIIFRKLRREVTHFAREQAASMTLLNRLFHLSKIEIEVLNLFMSGLSRTQVSKQRFVEDSTTKSQVHSILAKMQFSSISELVNCLKNAQLEEMVKQMAQDKN